MSRTSARVFDEYLVLGAISGDRNAFQYLVKRWQPKLLGHAYRLLGDQDQAKDALQDAWIDIHKGIGSLREERAFPAWAYRIVTRRCSKIIRSLQKDRKTKSALRTELSVQGSMSTPIDQTSESLALGHAIKQLSAGQQATLSLFYRQDMTIPEIAIILEIPTGTVKTRLMHARNKLRSILKGNHDG